MANTFEASVIRHADQRYETVGDWSVGFEGETIVRVSDLRDGRFEVLVAIHELIEATLCRSAGITDELVTAFDVAFEQSRADGHAVAACGCPIDVASEPGDDIHAPYYKQHQLAASVELMVAAEMGVNKQRYEDACQKAGRT